MCLDSDCGGLGRRDFLLAGAALAGLGTVTGQDAKPPPTRVLDDPGARHGRVVFQHNGHDTIDGYLARPRADGTYPAVLVVAGNRITEEYIPNTCAALALAGFVGLAPNVFHPLPDTARTPEEYDRFLSRHTELDRLDDLQAGASYLRAQPFVSSGGMGALGFCRGGREAVLFGARSREVDCVVAFHAAPVRPAEIARLPVPVQAHHGTADRSVPHTVTLELEKVLRAQKTPVEVFLYEGADHGFLAYTRPFYRPDEAQLAWKRAVEFLDRHLKRPTGPGR
jgi:carboxymethylenebutenolidase